LAAFCLVCSRDCLTKKQQMGGLVQAGAHASGRFICPADDYVLSMRVVFPTGEVREISNGSGDSSSSSSSTPSVFDLCRVAIGCICVVDEITLSLSPYRNYVENVTVETLVVAFAGLKTRLLGHKVVKYLILPLVDAAVVVTCDELAVGVAIQQQPEKSEQSNPLQRLIELLHHPLASSPPAALPPSPSIQSLRYQLMSRDPLNAAWVKLCQEVEVDTWKRSAGDRTGSPADILGMDCGSSQYVCEVAVPSGTVDKPSDHGELFVKEMVAAMRCDGMPPCHAPLEVRWSCGSGSSMSPAHGSKNDLFAWVGFIMYIPVGATEAAQVRAGFQEVKKRLWPLFDK
jgi:L-galactono-1,4-lactone dehydrogenase